MILIYSPSCVNITKSLIHMSAKILLREKSFQINFVFEKASIFELEFFSEFMELNVNLNVSYSSERMILVDDFKKIYNRCNLCHSYWIFAVFRLSCILIERIFIKWKFVKKTNLSCFSAFSKWSEVSEKQLLAHYSSFKL